MYLSNGSVQIANGSVRILNFAGSVPPASEINFAGPKTWDVKTDTAISSTHFKSNTPSSGRCDALRGTRGIFTNILKTHSLVQNIQNTGPCIFFKIRTINLFKDSSFKLNFAMLFNQRFAP